MTDRADSAAKQLEAVLDALQKSVLEANDQEVVKELQAAGIDPLKAMKVMDFAAERAVDEHFRRVREKLAQQRVESMRQINGVRGLLPSSRAEQLDLLKAIYVKHADVLTAQFRELTSFDHLADSELASMLQHLASLGYLSSHGGDGR